MTSPSNLPICTAPPGNPTLHPCYIEYFLGTYLQSTLYIHIFTISIRYEVKIDARTSSMSQTPTIKLSFHQQKRRREHRDVFTAPHF